MVRTGRNGGRVPKGGWMEDLERAKEKLAALLGKVRAEHDSIGNPCMQTPTCDALQLVHMVERIVKAFEENDVGCCPEECAKAGMAEELELIIAEWVACD